jgi:hypothetical protein
VSAESPVVDAVDPEQKPGSRLPRILLGALGGLVVLAGVWFLFLTPDTTASQAASTAGAADLVGEPEPVQADAAQSSSDLSIEALPVVTYDIYLARDPFEPVVDPDPPAGETSPDAAGPVELVAGEPTTDQPGTPVSADPTEPGTASPPGTDPQPSPTPGQPLPPGDGSSSGSCTGQEELVCDGRVVSFQGMTVRNGERVATIQVGTDVYEVAHGEVFASHFRVVEFVSDSMIRLQYGELIYELSASQRSMK